MSVTQAEVEDILNMIEPYTGHPTYSGNFEVIVRLCHDYVDLLKQDEVHWKTRRTLLKDNAALREAVALQEAEQIQITTSLEDDDIPTTEPLSLNVESLRQLRTDNQALREEVARLKCEIDSMFNNHPD